MIINHIHNSEKNKSILLDCTLRDGGYVNDWMFGRKNIQRIVQLLDMSGVDYIEMGFIRLDDYNPEQAGFNKIEQISDLIPTTRTKLAAMVEIGYGYPAAYFPQKIETNNIELIRLIIWKRLLKESVEYCKELVKKGYRVCVQVTRTDQYTEKEFIDLIKMFNETKIYGLYIVDTFGLMNKEMVLNYSVIADEYLHTDIALGYHAHNNMQQAFTNTIAMTEKNWKHQLMIDASVLGMGRGAGNLNLELYMKYCNDNYGTDYNIEPLITIVDECLMPFYKSSPWGYSMPYYLSAVNNVNPTYTTYFIHHGLTIKQIDLIFRELKLKDTNIVYDKNIADEMVSEFQGVISV
ncbi:hypothetical protein AGMMS50293_02700 [Spirochaetia bacterium]|nr:hypothetical protein AGMMS50293_02700 [Spirochaetia bacterium]